MGTFHKTQWDTGCQHSLRNVWIKAQTLEVGEDSLSSVPDILQFVWVSHILLYTLQEQKLNAYHIQSLQELVPHNAPARYAPSMVDFATVDRMPYVYSKRSIHGKIMIH
jgi:hypothetical protein